MVAVVVLVAAVVVLVAAVSFFWAAVSVFLADVSAFLAAASTFVSAVIGCLSCCIGFVGSFCRFWCTRGLRDPKGPRGFTVKPSAIGSVSCCTVFLGCCTYVLSSCIRFAGCYICYSFPPVHESHLLDEVCEGTSKALLRHLSGTSEATSEASFRAPGTSKVPLRHL